jgi:hypothetical protein
VTVIDGGSHAGSFIFARHYLVLKFLCIWGWATTEDGAGGLIDNTGTGTGTGAHHGPQGAFQGHLIK